jgi:glutamyl-tRNA(Gln) amidotransferase subunit E
VASLRRHVNAGDADCVIIVAGASEKQAACASNQVIRRANLALADKPVPEETRKMLENGSTAYMRPLPGAARMYPETDVLPVRIGADRWEAIIIPELLTVKAERFTKKYAIDRPYALHLAASEKLPLFQRAVDEGIKPKLAAFTLLSTVTEIRRDGVDVKNVSDDDYLTVWHAVEDGRAAKEAVPDILRSIAAGNTFEQAIKQLAPGVSREDLEAIIQKIIADRTDFIHQKKMAALGPLMGVVMAEVRGSVDGKVVSEILKRELTRAIAGN